MRRPDFVTLLHASPDSLGALAKVIATAPAKGNFHTQIAARFLPGGTKKALGALPFSHYTLQAI